MTPRRAPAGDERQRDAERSKQQLLDAAVIEFGTRGFSGARVSEIATRAGVNKQLISYYFGGKQGLYDAVTERWRADESALAGPAGTLGELVAAYARESQAQPDLARLLIRQGVDQDTSAGDEAEQSTRFQQVLADIRHRQSQGELAADLDPAYATLALFALSAAPITFPQIARALGLDPTTKTFTDQYADQLIRLVDHLAD